MNTADIQLPNTDSITGEPQEQTGHPALLCHIYVLVASFHHTV